MKRRFLVLFFLLVVFTSNALSVDLTKGQGEILDWTLLDDTNTNNPFAETTIQTFADDVELLLNITVAHKDTNASTINYTTVSVLTRAGSDNEAWRLHTQVTAGGGTATAEALNANSGVSQGNPERLEVAATGDFDTGAAQWLFLHDTGTLANSALVLLRGWSDNDYFINAWDLVRDYDSADILYNGVDQIQVRIPASVQFFNVTFHNSDEDATYAVRVDYTKVTAIE